MLPRSWRAGSSTRRAILELVTFLDSCEVEQPSQVCRDTRGGAPATRPEPQAKTDPFPPGTGAPVPGGRYAQEQRRNSGRSPRNLRASSGRRPPATAATRDVPTRERRPRMGRSPGQRPASVEVTPAEVLAGCGSGASRSHASLMRGPWWCLVRGPGPERTIPPPFVYHTKSGKFARSCSTDCVDWAR